MKLHYYFAALVLVSTTALAEKAPKIYAHASEFQIGVLDQNLRVSTGTDVTVAKTVTDSKLGPGGQGIHLLHTDKGDFRVEAPVNKGRTVGSVLTAGLANANRPVWAQVDSKTFHNKWFLDNVLPGTDVLFASSCAAPNKNHPSETVRCDFWFPDPDSTDHEYSTSGDFTPYIEGDGSNVRKVSETLCGTGKLRPEVAAKLCGIGDAKSEPPVPPAPPAFDNSGTYKRIDCNPKHMAEQNTTRCIKLQK